MTGRPLLTAHLAVSNSNCSLLDCKGLQPVYAINQLHKHLYKGVLVYLDDILIYTETKAEHMKLVRAVLQKRAAKLYAKLSKCKSHQSKIDYLGFWISHEGIESQSGVGLGSTPH